MCVCAENKPIIRNAYGVSGTHDKKKSPIIALDAAADGRHRRRALPMMSRLFER